MDDSECDGAGAESGGDVLHGMEHRAAVYDVISGSFKPCAMARQQAVAFTGRFSSLLHGRVLQLHPV